MNPPSQELTPCPALVWSERGCNFVIVKIGEQRYWGQFFYVLYQQFGTNFGTGREEYDHIGDCVVTLLQVQADHERGTVK